MKILFVCSGNISRSFLAEILFENEVEQVGADHIFASSAGLFAYPGNPPDSRMVDYLAGLGLSEKGHSATQVTREAVDWADLIMVMEQDHDLTIKKLWPEASHKVKRLGEFISDGQDADDIIDPFGKSPYHYRLAQSQISLAVKSLVKKLVSDKSVGPNAQDHNNSG